MKKSIMLPLAAALALGTAACSGSQEAANTAAANDLSFNGEDASTDANIVLPEGNLTGDDALPDAGGNGLDAATLNSGGNAF
jgi:hypothetical protein